jgi:hypothetical protein
MCIHLDWRKCRRTDGWMTHVHTLGHKYVQTCGHVYRRTDMNMLNTDRWNIDYRFVDFKGTVTSSFFVHQKAPSGPRNGCVFFRKVTELFDWDIILLCYIDAFRHWFLLIAWLITNCPCKGSGELSKSEWCLTLEQRNNGPSSCKIWANMTGNVIPAIKEDHSYYFPANSRLTALLSRCKSNFTT